MPYFQHSVTHRASVHAQQARRCSHIATGPAQCPQQLIVFLIPLFRLLCSQILPGKGSDMQSPEDNTPHGFP